MSCCDNMLKYIVFLFNFIFFLTGTVLIGAGAYVQIQMKNYFDFLGSQYLNSSIIFIIIGVVVLVVAFFGCCGACTENACMLYTYGTLMALILMVEIGLAVTVYIFKGDAQKFMHEAMQKGMVNYGEADHEGVKVAWDAIQGDFGCCGVTEYKDWETTNYGKTVNGVPDSCCKTFSTGCGKGIFGTGNTNGINTKGCVTELEEVITDNVAAVAGIGVGIAVFQVLAVIVTCFLGAHMRRKMNYV